jgi:predicted nuclease of restriction endonuclease-like (RecB) superfamily
MSKAVSKKELFQSIKAIILRAQQYVVRNINTAMLIAYFEIGEMIAEDELKGNERAGYAKQTVRYLSIDLTKEFGKGYSKSNLEYMRQFYKTYQHRIVQSPIGQSAKRKNTRTGNKENPSTIPLDEIIQSPVGQSGFPFSLSWTHYIQLMKISNEAERNFYEIEAVKNNWSVRELQRQFNAAIYERLALSRDKRGIKKLATAGQIIENPADALKSHYVLEFLNLKEDSQYTESELETAIITKLENFMLELGKGFLFEGRQRHFTFEGDSFFVDLVFYNRLLKCFVLFDLKIGKLTHQDIGQMQMYVNYYDRMIKTKEENNTIGIILCKEENKTVIEFTLPENNKTSLPKNTKPCCPAKQI